MIDAAGPQDEEERTQGVLTKAQILRDADRVGQAVAVLEAADRDLPDTVEIKYELAMLYERQDRVADLSACCAGHRAGPGPCPRLQRAGLHAGRPQPAAARGAGPDHAGAGAGAQRSVHPGQHGLGQVPHGRPAAAAEYLRRAYSTRPEADIAAHRPKCCGARASATGWSCCAAPSSRTRPTAPCSTRSSGWGSRFDHGCHAPLARRVGVAARALMAMLAFTLAACTTTPKPIEGIGPDAFRASGASPSRSTRKAASRMPCRAVSPGPTTVAATCWT